MKREGCSIIFLNDHHEVLLLLRDDKPDIPFPNMWDLPGGHVEKGETPEQCIAREMKEELKIDIKEYSLFSIEEFPDRIEHTFWQKVDSDLSKIKPTEGQYLKWFSEQDVKNTELALGFNLILNNFYRELVGKQQDLDIMPTRLTDAS